MSVFNNLKKRITDRGRSGLNQTSNSFRMAAAIVVPFLAVWFGVEIFAPVSWRGTATTFSFVGWIVYIFALYSKAKADVASFIPFPQSHWFFPDGQQISYDLLVPPNSWEQLPVSYNKSDDTPVFKYSDGSTLYRVHFKEKVSYQEPDRPYPDVFDRALWKLPAEWNDTFKRNGHGEFFYENLFVDHPACENIELSVVDWEERGSTRLPICLVTGCSYFFLEAMKSGGRDFPINKRTLAPISRKEAYIQDLKQEVRELRSRNGYLEDEAEQYSQKEPQSIKELTDKRLERIRNSVGSIMDTQLSWKDRILNAKFVGYALIGIAVLLLFTHFVFHYP